MAEQNEYFKYRQVGDSYYNNYTIPKHILSVLPTDKNTKVLDIGCGLGQFLFAVKKIGYNDITGVDISDEAVTACESKGLNVIKIDGITEFAESHGIKYDFILMSHVLEHLPKEIVIPTLKAIRTNLLSPAGFIMIMVPNAQSNTGAYWMFEDFTHYTLFTAGSIKYVLKSAGYEEIAFVNPDGTQFMTFIKKCVIKALLYFYKLKEDFWNLVTQSSFHKPSERIYSFELKVKAR